MNVRIYADRQRMSRAAARDAARIVRAAIDRRGSCRIVAATGESQIDFLVALTQIQDIEWERVELFHLDEYVGLRMDHPASFRKYLLDRLIAPTGIERYHLIDGEGDPAAAAERAGRAIAAAPVDVAFVGIGENGHLAFNDPPADFSTDDPYIVVTLDDACRRQQVGEGWFASVHDVPARAISMSIRQILASREIVCVVPDRRKADAVKNAVEGPISPAVPASILRMHPRATVYLDAGSASLLTDGTRSANLATERP